MVWHDLALGPALRFLNICAAVLSVEIIDTGARFLEEVDSSFEQLGNSN